MTITLHILKKGCNSKDHSTPLFIFFGLLKFPFKNKLAILLMFQLELCILGFTKPNRNIKYLHAAFMKIAV